MIEGPQSFVMPCPHGASLKYLASQALLFLTQLLRGGLRAMEVRRRRETVEQKRSPLDVPHFYRNPASPTKSQGDNFSLTSLHINLYVSYCKFICWPKCRADGPSMRSPKSFDSMPPMTPWITYAVTAQDMPEASISEGWKPRICQSKKR